MNERLGEIRKSYLGSKDSGVVRLKESDFDWLKHTVEEQQKEIELLNNTIEIITRALNKARTRDGKRSLEKIRLEKALSFYANKDNYYTDAMDKDNEGETARKALEGEE